MNLREDWREYKNFLAKHLPTRFAKLVENPSFDKYILIYLAGVLVTASPLFLIF